MKLKEMIKHLSKIDEEYPNNDFDVVYSIDDEGNEFRFVGLLPSVGQFDEDDRSFYNQEEMEYVYNAVCIN